MSGVLYLVGTPIGNLEDITLRALNVLRAVKLVAAEDTRQVRKLLQRYQVAVAVTSYGQHNARFKCRAILAELAQGRDVALVSDAGMPGISDPGAELVAEARRQGFLVTCIPGPSAAVAALALSGIAAPTWWFLGFLPRRPGPRRRLLSKVLAAGTPLVAFEAPHRVLDLLADLAELAPEAQTALAREMTKLHEEVLAGTPDHVRQQLAQRFPDGCPRGEYTLVIAGGTPARAACSPGSLADAVHLRVASGESISQAVRHVAEATGVSRQTIYKAIRDPEVTDPALPR
ncbi:MAG TPA: 16S rRNA (cytidine(1402)-2'-O)-methyltransferase [Clostridiales bacterium]|nr:16S rRNA (cytidine(1402)-2'-O)-methyltransferase [Clostridiales bacterium]